ncbi:MAG: hypothetical protein WAN35_04535 [Terracidiphilus sp.]
MEDSSANRMTKKQTSIWNCLWGLPFLLVGLSLFFYCLLHGLNHVTDSLTQVIVPGKAILDLQHGQSYSIFLEEQTIVNGKIYSTTQSVNGLECRVKPLLKNTTIALRKPSMSSSYDVGGRSGHSVLEFSIPDDGKYEFSCDYGESSIGPEVVVAVGSGVSKSIFSTVAGALVSFFGGAGACLVVVFAVLIKRDREKKRFFASSFNPSLRIE